MMNETAQMRQARHDLHLLSASDPAASGNMLRHVAAYSVMVTGRRGRERQAAEPQVVGGFVFTHGEHQLPAVAVRRSGVETIYLGFDVDDAAGPPVAAGVFRRQGDGVILYGNCRLWSPANDGRALLVPCGEGSPVGYLAFRPGQPLRLVEAPVPGDLEAGFRRARMRMQRLLASEALRDVHREGYLHRIHNVGQELFDDVTRVAA